MTMTVIVTRNVTERFRGFLTSCMLEIAPGVYTSPRLNPAVRQRLWDIFGDWSGDLSKDSGIVMTWYDPSIPQKQRVLTLKTPKRELIDYQGTILCRKV